MDSARLALLRLALFRPAGVVAAALLAACGSGTESGEGAPTDPAAAAAVAARENRAEDVVAPTAAEPADDQDGGSTNAEADDESGDESSDEELDLLAIRGEIISEYNLVQGECFNRVEGLQAGRRVVLTARVDCAEPHLAEVFHTFEIDVPHPGIYPGDDAMLGFALQECYDRFEPFVGMSYELSVYEIDVFTPNRTNFEHAAARYRGVHCWLHHIDNEPLQESARGTAR